MSNRQQLLAALFLALALVGISYFIAFAPISVHYTESANLDRNWERLSSLAVRHLRVYGGNDNKYAAVRAVITEGAQRGDRLKLASSVSIDGVAEKFDAEGDDAGPFLVVRRGDGSLTPAEVNQVLEAIQFSTDSRRPAEDLPRHVQLSVLKAADGADADETPAKVFDFKISVSGQNDIPRVRFLSRNANRFADAKTVTLASREPVKIGDLFDRIEAGDGDRYDFFTVDFSVLTGKLSVSGVGLPGGDFAGAPLAWSETLPYTQREEYFLDVAGKHVTLQSRRYPRVVRLLNGKSADLWGMTYAPPKDLSRPDVLTVRVNDHGDGVGHPAAESVQTIQIRFAGETADGLSTPDTNREAATRKVFMEVVRLAHRQAKDLIPVLSYSLPDGSSVDAKKNTLIVKGTPEAISELRDSIRQLDVPLRSIRLRYIRAAALSRFLSEAEANTPPSGHLVQEGVSDQADPGNSCKPDFELAGRSMESVLEDLPADRLLMVTGVEGQPRDLGSMDARIPDVNSGISEKEWSGLSEGHRPVQIRVELTAHLLNAEKLILLAHVASTEKYPDEPVPLVSRVSANARGSLGEWLYVDTTCGSDIDPSGDATVPALRMFVRVDLM